MALKQSQKIALIYAQSFPSGSENILSKHVCQHFQQAKDYRTVANIIICNLVWRHLRLLMISGTSNTHCTSKTIEISLFVNDTHTHTQRHTRVHFNAYSAIVIYTRKLSLIQEI